MLNHSIGPYSIIREIAEDTLGRVFEAVDPARKKHVIIKSLRPETASRPEVLSRLYSEAKTLALLNHPHIARIFGFIRANDNIYLVMELVAGESLQSVLKEKGRLDPNLVLAIFHQIITAVKYAHELRVVHGDLKPSNVMVASFAQIKILNFAIAPILGDLDIHHHGLDSVPYMAPERIARQPVDARSDIYSLGALLYEAIVGRVPFTGNDQEEVRRSACTSTPLRPSLLIGDCPEWLDVFLLRALAAAPEDRFSSVAAMAQAMGPAAPGRVRGAAPKGIASSTPPGRIQRIGSVRSNRHDAANSKVRAPALSLRGVIGTLQRKQAVARRSLGDAAGAFRRSVMAVQPWSWTRPAALKIQAWTRGIRSRGRSVGASAVTVQGRLAARWAALAETNWKRHAVLATLIAAVLIETFVFGGANTLLKPDMNVIPALNQNGAAQGVLSDLPRPAPAAAKVDPEPPPPPQSKVAKRVDRGARISEQTNARSEDSHHEALTAKRTVTYRETENYPNRAVVQDVRVADPVKRTPEKNSPQVQLNVRWEN